MKCELCGRTIKRETVEKVLRGKKHIFCTESCFNLYFYNIKNFNYDRVYSRYCDSVPVNIQQLEKEAE
jgi:hypothetical protein